MTILKKGELIGTIFLDGVKAQLHREWTWGTCLAMGLHQGLKYRGSIKRGIQGAFAVVVVLSAASGIYNIKLKWDEVKQIISA